MNRNDGQRRIDAKDQYAPYVVRPAIRVDPNLEPSLEKAMRAIGGLIALAIIFYLAIRFGGP